jgi:hypothetical protein
MNDKELAGFVTHKSVKTYKIVKYGNTLACKVSYSDRSSNYLLRDKLSGQWDFREKLNVE